MRGASTLIPARFLILIAHLCVMVTLLWETNQSSKLCLISPHHQITYETYKSRLVGGFAASIAFILLEMITFICGLTMFSYTMSLLSIASHGFASILLTYFVLDGWYCEWFWMIFAFGSVLPSVVDCWTAVLALCSKGW